MNVHLDSISDLKEIVPLVAECGLPVSDLSSSGPPLFWGVRVDGQLVAVVGLELRGTVALLRSLAVSPTHRKKGLARRLVAHAENTARSLGVETIYLLTTTDSDFFSRLGYLPLPRAAAPAPIQATAQFSLLCPVSSAFLSKKVVDS